MLLCEIQFSHAITLNVTLLFLCISCIVFQIIDYYYQKKTITGVNQQSSVGIQNDEALNHQLSPFGMETIIRTIIGDIVRLILLSFSVLAFTFSHLVCLQVYSETNLCSRIVELTPYFKELVTFHTVNYTIVFLKSHRDFFSDFIV